MLIEDVMFNLNRQILLVLQGRGEELAEAEEKAQRICLEFFRAIPQVRAMVQTDVQASYDGDPAASGKDEIIFSYPGLGSAMYAGVTAADYPLISATTLIITVMVLLATLILDIVYGLIDPRVKAAQFD
jgi:hypothetical protein